MNRRGFLKFAAAAPLAAPVIAAQAAQTAGFARGGVLSGGGVEFGEWINLTLPSRDYSFAALMARYRQSRPLTLSESVNASVAKISRGADHFAAIGTRAQTALNAVADLAVRYVDKVSELSAPDPVVAEQMADDGLFEAETSFSPVGLCGSIDRAAAKAARPGAIGGAA